MKKIIIQQSLRNIERHLEKESYVLYGILKGRTPGGFSKVYTSDRAYHIYYLIDEAMERFYLDVYPQITCEKPYIHMVHAYVNKKTSGYKSGRIDVDDNNGEIKVRVESSIVDQPISVESIADMERLAVRISDGIERRLDKLSHGVLFSEDDPDVMSVMERKIKELSERLESKSGRSDDEDDENDDEEDDDEDLDKDKVERLSKVFREMKEKIGLGFDTNDDADNEDDDDYFDDDDDDDDGEVDIQPEDSDLSFDDLFDDSESDDGEE